jgi:hypothetical protein
MNATELKYVKRALEVYETQELSLEDRRKILQTISEITARAAIETKDRLVDSLIV